MPPGQTARVLAVATFLGIAAVASGESKTGTSPTCGPIVGQSQEDLNSLRSFCAEGIVAGLTEGAYAAESLLFLKVPAEVAGIMVARPLQTEQLIRNWMRGWRVETGLSAVTVTVEWGDVEIAKGQTTLFGGDRVTIRGS